MHHCESLTRSFFLAIISRYFPFRQSALPVDRFTAPISSSAGRLSSLAHLSLTLFLPLSLSLALSAIRLIKCEALVMIGSAVKSPWPSCRREPTASQPLSLPLIVAIPAPYSIARRQTVIYSSPQPTAADVTFWPIGGFNWTF